MNRLATFCPAVLRAPRHGRGLPGVCGPLGRGIRRRDFEESPQPAAGVIGGALVGQAGSALLQGAAHGNI